ncbi:hypothetical protein N7501_007693 [Penicillium viridicatum]|nr:hypothetical protein N7501_007693 [Penicillium viridicatum]
MIKLHTYLGSLSMSFMGSRSSTPVQNHYIGRYPWSYACIHIFEHKCHISLTPSSTIEQKESQESKKIDRRRDRTCNLLIRSQAPCHWASRPV